MSVQWMQLGYAGTLVASDAGAWIQQPQPCTVGLRGSMPAATSATVTSTRHLLDGAIAAAERFAKVPSPSLSAASWTQSLVDQWYTAHHSVGLLPVAIERYGASGREELARFAQLKLEEEQGHDQLALNDLRNLGHDAEAVVERLGPTSGVGTLVDYGRGLVRGANPVGFFGYIYALERRVLRITPRLLGTLQAVLPAGVEAASGVRAHAEEFDAGHVEELVEFIAALAADDRTRIALACHRTAELACTASG